MNGSDRGYAPGRAADLLGVSISTLRYWDRTGRLKPTRHPISRYRRYRRGQLEARLWAAARDAPETGGGRA